MMKMNCKYEWNFPVCYLMNLDRFLTVYEQHCYVVMKFHPENDFSCVKLALPDAMGCVAMKKIQITDIFEKIKKIVR